jgi:excisionase family DNA binding protein
MAALFSVESSSESVKKAVMNSGPRSLAVEPERNAPFVDDLLCAVVKVLRARPDLADALRSVFVEASRAPNAEKTFMSVREYAVHVGYSKRTVENLIGHGLPLSGTGRLRRVPVAEADKWLKQGGASLVLERRARLDAKRRAMNLVERPHEPSGGK